MAKLGLKGFLKKLGGVDVVVGKGSGRKVGIPVAGTIGDDGIQWRDGFEPDHVPASEWVDDPEGWKKRTGRK